MADKVCSDEKMFGFEQLILSRRSENLPECWICVLLIFNDSSRFLFFMLKFLYLVSLRECSNRTYSRSIHSGLLLKRQLSGNKNTSSIPSWGKSAWRNKGENVGETKRGLTMLNPFSIIFLKKYSHGQKYWVSFLGTPCRWLTVNRWPRRILHRCTRASYRYIKVFVKFIFISLEKVHDLICSGSPLYSQLA